MTSPTPSGTIGESARGPELRFERRFTAGLQDVWAAVTESERLERWIGRWEGDLRSGRVTFFMTAEDDDVEGEDVTVLECVPPYRFLADTRAGEGTWHLRVHLSHENGVTTLEFAQLAGDDDLSSVGPGWEFYLDRLAATFTGGTVDDVTWEDYYPAMRDHYAALARTVS